MEVTSINGTYFVRRGKKKHMNATTGHLWPHLGVFLIAARTKVLWETSIY